MSAILPRRFISQCDDGLLTEFVYSKTLVIGRYSVSMDFSDDGTFLYSGRNIDRVMECYTTTGDPWEIDGFSRFGINWSDSPGGNNGRRNCPGLQCGPGNPPTYIISTHDTQVNGVTVKWGMPTVDRNGDPLDPSLYGTFDGNNSNDNTGGMVIEEQKANAYSGPAGGWNRVINFRINPEGTRFICKTNSASNILVQWDFGTAWNVPTLSVISSSGNPATGSQNCVWLDEAGFSIYTASGQTAYQYCTSEAWTVNSETVPANPTLAASVDISTLLPSALAAAMGTITNIMLSPTKDRMYILESSGSASANIHQFNR